MLKNLHVSNRKNTIQQWSPSDSEENYKLYQKNGKINYTKDAFSYAFNSHGFRCDEFTENSDFPVLFLGCSFTEGIGLPMDDVWPSLVLNRIRDLPQNKDKKIPFWSVAKGGTGIDAMAHELILHIDMIKPKYIFYHLGNYNRRDYCDDSLRIKYWAPGHSDMNEPFSKTFTNDYYSVHQFYRSLAIIDLASQKHDTKVFIFESTPMDRKLLKQIFDDFPRIELISTKYPLANISPEFVRQKLTQEQFDHYKTCPEYARDNMHPGPLWQFILADDIWNNIKKEFI